MYGQSLAGNIPPEIGKLHYLEVLDLRHCQLSGPVPAEWISMTNLVILQLAFNSLSGPVSSIFSAQNEVSCVCFL
jgi:hypothetical protein